MSGRIVNDVRVYQDSAGVWREDPSVLDPSLCTMPLGYEQITNDDLAGVCMLVPPAGARLALIQNNGSQPVRFRDDGINPAPTIGQRIEAGVMMNYSRSLPTFRAIREADGAQLDVAYYG